MRNFVFGVLLPQIAVAFVPAVLAGMTALLAFGANWLRTKTKNTKLYEVEYRFLQSIESAVAAVLQTYVSTVREAGGALTAAQQKSARDQAIENVRTYLGAKGVDEVKRVLGYSNDQELHAAIATQIESMIATTKAKSAVATATVSATAAAPTGAFPSTEIAITKDVQK